jgi:hypothetical protein
MGARTHTATGEAAALGTGAALGTAVGNLRGFLEHGGVVRYGTDLGNGPLPLGVNEAELLALSAAGLSVDDLLAAMTDVDPVTGSRFVAGVAPCLVPGGSGAPRVVRADALPDTPEGFAAALKRAHAVPPDVRQ